MDIYELESENLTGLGGPMGMPGTDRTWTNYRKFFTHIAFAKDYADKEHRHRQRYKPIQWKT